MIINEIQDGMKVKTTVGLLGFDSGTVGKVKFDNGDPVIGKSGETVLVGFTNGGGLYYSPADLVAA
jgi:hypothetical protein